MRAFALHDDILRRRQHVRLVQKIEKMLHEDVCTFCDMHDESFGWKLFRREHGFLNLFTFVEFQSPTNFYSMSASKGENSFSMHAIEILAQLDVAMYTLVNFE